MEEAHPVAVIHTEREELCVDLKGQMVSVSSSQFPLLDQAMSILPELVFYGHETLCIWAGVSDGKKGLFSKSSLELLISV